MVSSDFLSNLEMRVLLSGTILNHHLNMWRLPLEMSTVVVSHNLYQVIRLLLKGIDVSQNCTILGLDGFRAAQKITSSMNQTSPHESHEERGHNKHDFQNENLKLAARVASASSTSLENH